MKKKLRRAIVFGSILTATILPFSAFASLQPINKDILPILGNNITLPENIQELLKIPPIIDATQELFRSINSGNIKDTIDRLSGILGELGLLDPAYESTRIGTEAANSTNENPYLHPQTPEEVYELQRHVDVVRSEIPQKLSQSVFGMQAQQALARQNEILQKAQQASLQGQQGVAATAQASAQKAQQNMAYAQNVATQARQAQSLNISQEVLKAMAMQSEELAKISAGNSTQLAQLGQAASYQSAQLSAANVQLTALNERTQSLQVLGASQNYQMAQISAGIDRQNYYQETKDSLQQNAAYQASNLVYIPGFVSSGDNL
ncbi:hypothetical protein ABN584_25205 [Gloeocapsa sp. BRSZ]